MDLNTSYLRGKRYLQGINTKDDLLKCEKIIKEDYANKL